MPQNVANLCLSSEGIDEVPLRETFEVLYKAASTCETSGIDSITIGGPRDLYRGIQHLGLQAIVGSFVRLAPVTSAYVADRLVRRQYEGLYQEVLEVLLNQDGFTDLLLMYSAAIGGDPLIAQELARFAHTERPTTSPDYARWFVSGMLLPLCTLGTPLPSITNHPVARIIGSLIDRDAGRTLPVNLRPLILPPLEERELVAIQNVLLAASEKNVQSTEPAEPSAVILPNREALRLLPSVQPALPQRPPLPRHVPNGLRALPGSPLHGLPIGREYRLQTQLTDSILGAVVFRDGMLILTPDGLYKCPHVDETNVGRSPNVVWDVSNSPVSSSVPFTGFNAVSPSGQHIIVMRNNSWMNEASRLRALAEDPNLEMLSLFGPDVAVHNSCRFHPLEGPDGACTEVPLCHDFCWVQTPNGEEWVISTARDKPRIDVRRIEAGGLAHSIVCVPPDTCGDFVFNRTQTSVSFSAARISPNAEWAAALSKEAEDTIVTLSLFSLKTAHMGPEASHQDRTQPYQSIHFFAHQNQPASLLFNLSGDLLLLNEQNVPMGWVMGRDGINGFKRWSYTDATPSPPARISTDSIVTLSRQNMFAALSKNRKGVDLFNGRSLRVLAHCDLEVFGEEHLTSLRYHRGIGKLLVGDSGGGLWRIPLPEDPEQHYG